MALPMATCQEIGGNKDLHLRDIFLRCCHYNIWLNLHKCVFCIETGRLLGFVVFKDGIRIDPLKISTIINLPAPTNILELQNLQGKANFLRCFVCNFIGKMHGYMRLLKKNTPFFWDDQAQHAFNNLKHALTHSPWYTHRIIQRTFSCILLPPLLPSPWF